MLARFDERAAGYDRENRFFDEDFEELRRVRLPARAPCPTEFGGAGLGLDEYAQLASAGSPTSPRPPRSPSTCTATGPGVAADLLQDGRRRRAGGSSSGPPRARSSPPSTARPATTCRCCCRRRQAERGRRRLGDHRPQDLRQPLARCGPTAGSTPWTPPIPPNPKIVHGFLPRDTPGLPDRRHVGHARHAGHAEPGHRPRQGVRARRARRAGVPRRVRRRRPVPGRRSSPGR